MATVDPAPNPESITAKLTESHQQLSYELRRLTRVATFVAIISSPSVYYYFHHYQGWAVGKSLVMTLITCAACRGLCDILIRKVIPWPSLFGSDDRKLREDDIMNRRRAWTWKWFLRWSLYICSVITVIYMIQIHTHPAGVSWLGIVPAGWERVVAVTHNPLFAIYALQLPFLFLTNFLIFLGPLVLMGVMQMKVFQPGDADWGVKLDDVRGQSEAKEEIRRIIALWQSGEVFESAGGKRERGLIFYGAPGTGKTMMAKAIATGFNSPFITMPGSGFAQTFIGIDAVIVRILAWRAKRQAKKWGGQCIVFIDEIDAVGLRRQALAGGASFDPNFPDHIPTNGVVPQFYGQFGAVNPSGDIIRENEVWREWLFRQQAPERRGPYPGWYQRVSNTWNQGIFPGMGGGGGLALNQLLVVMDGVDNPPFWRNFWMNRGNSFFDAIYIVPRRVRKTWAYVIAVGLEILGAFFILNALLDETNESPFYAPLTAATAAWNIIIIFCGAVILLTGVGIWGAASGRRKRREEARQWHKQRDKDRGDDDTNVSLRLPKSKPTGNQIYFIGATNVSLSALDPALIRPGRMGRHVWFRTPTKEDRLDIFDLYLGKVAHDPALDTPARRDEIARITNGYSPSRIEQICSMALTNAHHTGRAYFGWEDLVEAMTVIESGSAVNVKYHDDDSRGIAIHEAGHAIAAHVYRPDLESSRLSIRMRGGSLGHHQSFEKEERFNSRQGTVIGDMIHGLGALAAEIVFYGENSIGVYGDLGGVSGEAAGAVGAVGMSLLPIDLKGKSFPDETEAQSHERVISRLEDLGSRLMQLSSIQRSAEARLCRQLVGYAFVTAYNLVRINREKVQTIADAVYEQKEIYGDDLVRLLDAQEFVKPDVDWTAEETWPQIMYYTKLRRDEERERVALEREGKGDGPDGHDEFERMM